MVPRPLAAARAMRSRTCADVIQPCLVLSRSRESTLGTRLERELKKALRDTLTRAAWYGL